ncbi:hypothetical protein N780_05575 [Pontibacillus chungwhensis BH030062]|uniref:DUF5640 domain-containing protein n=1 Tax=Pontibacillus chungwhensis BH030062 TaxID=1385513 RepID=A0A0A2UQ62_9BACI|nr:hypothetical protein [Pontibacillus chungwhensis]KGP90412.1 hypothetical protein N780_05575 [Pontibacillus chungwhensis BH030062]
MTKRIIIIAGLFFFTILAGCNEKPPSLYGTWVILEEGGSFHTGDRLTIKEDGVITLNGWTSQYELIEDQHIKIVADRGKLMWSYNVTKETLTLQSKNSKHDMKVSAQRILKK